MNLLKATVLILMISVITASATPRFVLVRVKDIFTTLPSTTRLQTEVKSERDAITKNERANQLRKIIAELQTLQAQLSDKANPIDEATSKKLSRTYEIKRQEARTLQEDYESYKSETEKTINKKMVINMRASLDRIVKISNKIAKEKGFVTVIDSSGSTNTGVPFVLYSKNAPDITEEVQAAIQDSDPTEKPIEKPVASPTSKP